MQELWGVVSTTICHLLEKISAQEELIALTV